MMKNVDSPSLWAEEVATLRAEVERLTKANSNLISQAEESAFNATEITDWRIERIAEMGYEAARLRAEIKRLRASLVGMLTLAMTHQREKWPEVIAANEARRDEVKGLKAIPSGGL